MLTRPKLASWLSNLSLKKVLTNMSGWMQEVHITNQIFPSHVVAFRIANSKKSHCCRNTGETMSPGLCQNSSVAHGAFWVGPRSEPCQPMVRTTKSRFDKAMRSFQTNWYANREWLEYSAQWNACYCLLLMTEKKYLLIQYVRTGKQVWRQVRDWTSIQLANRTFKLYPCGWSVKQEKKAVLQLT